MTSNFSERVIVVAGAAGNVGQAIVQQFAGAGAKLALAEYDVKRLDYLPQSLPLDSSNSMRVMVDASNIESVQQMVEQVIHHFGKIDVLVHTVGGYAAGQPVHESGIEVWDKMIALNARSTYIVTGQVAKHMVERDAGGKIITILARNALQGMVNAGAYSASKAAAQRIVESMAAELRTRGINVNGIMPGNIDTPQNREAMPDADYDTWVTTEDIANLVMFLASDKSNAINGASIPIYGCT